MKKLVFFTIWILNFCSVIAMATDKKYPAWIQEMATHVRTFSRNVVIYHYGNAPRILGSNETNIDSRDSRLKYYTQYLKNLSLNIIDDPNGTILRMLGLDEPYINPRDPRLNYYVHYSTERFFTESDNGGMAGTGLYFASDPASSYGYGVHPAGVLKSEFKKGTRFFNSKDFDGTINFSEEAKHQLVDLSCGYFLNPSYVAQPQLEGPCLELKRILMDTLDVHVVAYGFSFTSIDVCPYNQENAFVVNSHSVFDREKTFIFRPESKAIPQAQEEFALYREYMKRTRFSDSMLPKLKEYPKDKFDAWAKEHIFGCGNYPEDQ